jgi:hypothetical protein
LLTRRGLFRVYFVNLHFPYAIRYRINGLSGNAMTSSSHLLFCFLDLTVNASGWQPRDVVTLAFSVAGLSLSLLTLYLTVLRPAALKELWTGFSTGSRN